MYVYIYIALLRKGTRLVSVTGKMIKHIFV